jgi:hypothetical protein
MHEGCESSLVLHCVSTSLPSYCAVCSLCANAVFSCTFVFPPLPPCATKPCLPESNYACAARYTASGRRRSHSARATAPPRLNPSTDRALAYPFGAAPMPVEDRAKRNNFSTTAGFRPQGEANARRAQHQSGTLSRYCRSSVTSIADHFGPSHVPFSYARSP